VRVRVGTRRHFIIPNWSKQANLPGRSHPGHGGFPRFQIKRRIARRLNRIRINLDFSRLNAAASSAQEGTISRRLEHKSFISKPLESKTRFIALSDGRVAGLA
jgi:hypothetical protein